LHTGSFPLGGKVDVGIGQHSLTTEAAADIRLAITSHDWLKHTMPIIGAVALAQQCSLKIAELVKTEPGMVAGTAKVPVVGRPS